MICIKDNAPARLILVAEYLIDGGCSMNQSRQVSRLLEQEHRASLELLGQVELRLNGLHGHMVPTDAELSAVVPRFIHYLADDLTVAVANVNGRFAESDPRGTIGERAGKWLQQCANVWRTHVGRKPVIGCDPDVVFVEETARFQPVLNVLHFTIDAPERFDGRRVPHA